MLHGTEVNGAAIVVGRTAVKHPKRTAIQSIFITGDALDSWHNIRCFLSPLATLTLSCVLLTQDGLSSQDGTSRATTVLGSFSLLS